MAEASAGAGRLSVERSVEIAAPPATVWARVGRFGDMAWHPAIHSTENPGGEMVGAVRVLTLGDAHGPTVTEELVARSDEARRYAYRILAVDPSVLPVVNYTSEVAVSPGTGEGSVLSWPAASIRRRASPTRRRPRPWRASTSPGSMRRSARSKASVVPPLPGPRSLSKFSGSELAGDDRRWRWKRRTSSG